MGDTHHRISEIECPVCERKFSRKGNLQAHKKVCGKCKHCHEQLSPPSELLNHICPGKNTTEPAAKRFKPDKSALQTSFVPRPSNQAQNPVQLIPESIFVILFNFRSRKTLKIKRPNKKSAGQNNDPKQNPVSVQPTTCPRNLISS